MALSPETQAWLEDLKKEGSLDDAAYNALKATFENDKVNNFVKGSVLRQADYSRQSASVQQAQKDLEAAKAALDEKEKAVTKFQGDLATWKAGAEPKFDQAVKEREQALNKANAALARLRSIAAAQGLDENEVLKDIEVVTVAEKKEDKIDTTGFLRKEDLQRGIAESALVDASIHDVAVEYQELTGKPLKGASQLVEEAIKAGKPIAQFAAEKFGFDKLRQDKADAAYQERLKQDTDAAVAKRLSEMNLQGNITPGRTDLRGSPVLGGDAAKMPDKDHQAGGGVSAAVAAFQAGKYKS